MEASRRGTLRNAVRGSQAHTLLPFSKDSGATRLEWPAWETDPFS